MDSNSCSEFMIIKKEAKTKKSQFKDEVQRQGRWNKEQNMKYLLFLSFNLSKFECKKKRMFRLYKPLSKFIITRNSQQCRSHHRKLIQRFKTPKNIISNMNQFFENGELENIRKENQEKLQKLFIPQKKIKTQEKIESQLVQMVQEKINQNQNNQKTADQIQEGQGSIVSDICPSIDQNYGCSIFSPSAEVTIVDYQAYNWYNQICLANYNYLLYSNYPVCLDSNLSLFIETKYN